MINWIFQNLFYEPLGIDYIYPVASTIYSGIEESINITHNILITTEKLNVKKDIYIDLSNKNNFKDLDSLLFIDSNYWDLYRKLWSYHKLISNQFNWIYHLIIINSLHHSRNMHLLLNMLQTVVEVILKWM